MRGCERGKGKRGCEGVQGRVKGVQGRVKGVQGRVKSQIH